MDNETFLSILGLYPTGQELVVNGEMERLLCMDKHVLVTDKDIRMAGSVQPLLKSLSRMSSIEASVFLECNQDKLETGAAYHIIEITEFGIDFRGLFETKTHMWRWKEKHKSFKDFSPLQLLWLLKNRFDVFGLIKQGRAIEKI